MEGNKKKLCIGVLALVLVLALAAVIYFVFIKKDEVPVKEEATAISIKKSLEVYAFNVLLDTNGKAYLDLREENVFATDDSNYDDNILALFKDAKLYSYNGKTEKLVELRVEDVKDIQAVNFGNGGGKYLLFFNEDDKLYGLVDYDVERTADIEVKTSEKLNKVTGIYSESDNDGTMVYAKAIINNKEENVPLYEIFE